MTSYIKWNKGDSIRTNWQRRHEISKEIQNDCRKAKENYTNSQCSEIEEMGKQSRLREMHNKIKLVFSRTKSRIECRCTEDKSEKTPIHSKQIVYRENEYIEELYEDDAPYFHVSTGENIIKEEVANVIKMMKNGKKTESEEVLIEALKVLDKHNLKVVTDLWNTIYIGEYIPADMKQPIFVPLLKKPIAQKSTEFRTIRLMTHVSN